MKKKKKKREILISVPGAETVKCIFLAMMKRMISYTAFAKSAIILTGVIVTAILIPEIRRARRIVVNKA